MKSQFKGKCYPANNGCGAEWEEGDEIEKTGFKNSKGNDAFCIHGKKCPGATGNQSQQTITSAEAANTPAKTDESIILFAQKALTGFLGCATANGLKEIDVKDQCGPVYSTALITASKK